MQAALYFLHLSFAGIVALFAPVNPLGSALMVNPLLEGLDLNARHRAAAKIALYCASLCLAVLFVGSWFFKLFGVSLPVVQLAGGLLICRMAWQLLSTSEGALDANASPLGQRPKGNVEGLLFYPIAFPMTTGAGAIAVLLTLSADAHAHLPQESTLVAYLSNLAALVLAVLIICLAVYLSYAYTPSLIRRLGTVGGQIVNRLSAFLVFCVGLQIAASGIQHLLGQSS